MKLSASRSLRPTRPARWPWRLLALLGALVMLCGLGILLAGAAALAGLPLVELDDALLVPSNTLAGGVALLAGLLLLSFARRRLRTQRGLALAPHLLRRRG